MASKTMPTKRVAPRRLHPVWLSTGLAMIALGGGIALWLLMNAERASGDPAEMLVAQMQAAARGESQPAFHVLGGGLRTVYGQGRINVIAEDVPSSPCVKAGWRLAKTGTLIINGVLPARLSAAKLSELCENGATLIWVPD